MHYCDHKTGHEKTTIPEVRKYNTTHNAPIKNKLNYLFFCEDVWIETLPPVCNNTLKQIDIYKLIKSFLGSIYMYQLPTQQKIVRQFNKNS